MAIRLKGKYGSTEDRVNGGMFEGSVKDQFRKDALRFLRAVGRILAADGWTTEHLGYNAGGPAVSGEATAVFYAPGENRGAYVHVSDIAIPGVARTSPCGIGIMYRATRREIQWTGLRNRWDAPWNVTAERMAEMLAEASLEARRTA